MTETIPSNEKHTNEIAKRTNDILMDIMRGKNGLHGDTKAERGGLGARAWAEAIPMISTVLAALESETGTKIDSSSFNELVKSKPLEGKEIAEFGFGGVGGLSMPMLLFLPHLGARMYGIEPRADAVEQTQGYVASSTATDKKGNRLLHAEDLKVANAEQMPLLFKGKKFDMVISNRVMEEYPMAGNDSIEEGIDRANGILAMTGLSLKEGGFSIHITTAPFLPKAEAMKTMGYEVITRNQKFTGRGLGVYYFTILRRASEGN